MPISPYPTVSFSVTLGAGANTEAAPQPFDNTKEILVLNLDAANEALIRFATDGGAVALTTANSLRLPAGTAVTLAIGPTGERNPLRTAASPQPYPTVTAEPMSLWFRAAAGAPVINVTYVNSRGYVLPK